MKETQTLACFLCEASCADLPPSTLHEAKRCLLDWLGCTLGGCHYPSVDILLRLFARLGGKPQATVLGRSTKTTLLHAALANGVSAHVLDYDDTHLPTVLHTTGPLAAALLALAEELRCDGRSLLTAFVLGYEAAARVARSVYPAHYDQGWHITGTAGTFGAAAGAGKLLGLTPEPMTQALGLAATQAAGLREMFGSMAKAFHPGKAAQNGLLAALLAAEGFTSSQAALEAPRGFCHVLSPSHDLSAITANLGHHWEIAYNAVKPYACGVVTHPTIDAILWLRREYAVAPEAVASINIRAHPLVLELCGKREPQNGLEGKFSIFYTAAIALLEGAGGPAQFTDAKVHAPPVVALRQAVQVQTDPSLREDEAAVTLTLQDGWRLDRHVEHASGSPNNPLTDAQLQEKFQALAEPLLPRDQQRRILELVWNLEELPDVTSLIESCQPA